MSSGTPQTSHLLPRSARTVLQNVYQPCPRADFASGDSNSCQSGLACAPLKYRFAIRAKIIECQMTGRSRVSHFPDSPGSVPATYGDTMGKNEVRFRIKFNEWLSWDETQTHYFLRHASGFQFLNVPKWAIRGRRLLFGDVCWNSAERVFKWTM